MDLTPENKLFWFYVKDNCNHVGVWRVNKKQFEYTLGHKFDLDSFFEICNSDKERIVKLSNDKWFIVSFVIFQYGNKFTPKSNVHKSVIKELELNGIDTSFLDLSAFEQKTYENE